MYSYDWIVMVTLGLDRWEKERRPSPHEIELRAARKLHEARKPPAPQSRLAWLSRRRRRHQETTACS